MSKSEIFFSPTYSANIAISSQLQSLFPNVRCGETIQKRTFSCQISSLDFGICKTELAFRSICNYLKWPELLSLKESSTFLYQCISQFYPKVGLDELEISDVQKFQGQIQRLSQIGYPLHLIKINTIIWKGADNRNRGESQENFKKDLIFYNYLFELNSKGNIVFSSLNLGKKSFNSLWLFLQSKMQLLDQYSQGIINFDSPGEHYLVSSFLIEQYEKISKKTGVCIQVDYEQMFNISKFFRSRLLTYTCLMLPIFLVFSKSIVDLIFYALIGEAARFLIGSNTGFDLVVNCLCSFTCLYIGLEYMPENMRKWFMLHFFSRI